MIEVVLQQRSQSERRIVCPGYDIEHKAAGAAPAEDCGVVYLQLIVFWEAKQVTSLHGQQVFQHGLPYADHAGLIVSKCRSSVGRPLSWHETSRRITTGNNRPLQTLVQRCCRNPVC